MKRFAVALLVCLALSIAALPIVMGRVSAAVTAASWNASRIIDDGIFTAGNGMTVAEIQDFLNTRVQACDTYGQKPSPYSAPDFNGDGKISRAEYGQSIGAPAPFTCLRDYYEVPKLTPGPTEPASNYGGSAIPEGAKSAAQLIADAGQRYNINPKVLLVKLATESAGPLTSDDWPFKKQYMYAMGAHCPDSGPGGSANCDPNYSGFSLQIYEAASLLRWYLDNMGQPWWSYKKPFQNNYILWNVEPSGCGGSSVYVDTRATAALYTYTPYQPNQAALTNMYGTGDGCSAYGNRNFWRVFNDWFGNSRVNGRVSITQYDMVADKDGDPAYMGFSLNFRPTHSVTIYFTLSDAAVLGVVGDVTSVTILPDNWNKPDKNIVTFYGKDDGTITKSVTINTTEIASADPQFDLLNSEDIGDPDIVVQGGNRAVTRLYSPVLKKHTYTTRQAEIDRLVADGYTNEGVSFYGCQSGELNVSLLGRDTTSILMLSRSSEYDFALANGFREQMPQFSASSYGTVPVYRLINTSSSNYFFTPDQGERDYAVANYGYIYEGVAFNACGINDRPIYRMYNPATNRHLYTASPAERDAAGGSFLREGPAFYLDSSVSNTVPVYRLYYFAKKRHFYTQNINEKDSAVAQGYVYEGIAFNIPQSPSTTPVYRLYNANVGHFYTASVAEKSSAESGGFVYEGIGYNAR